MGNVRYFWDSARWRFLASWGLFRWLIKGLPKETYQCIETGEWVTVPRRMTIGTAWRSWRIHVMWEYEQKNAIPLAELMRRMKETK